MIFCKLKFKHLLIITVLIVTSCGKENTDNNPVVNLLPKKYNEACFLMTHNAMNSKEKGFSIPNQTLSVFNQLNRGVRGLMLDTYDGSNGIALTYHASSALGQSKLVDVMQEIKDFLLSNPNEVISIIFQNEGGNTQLQKAIDSIGLDTMTFIHTNGTDWPTIQTMVDSNQRLVLFVEQNKLPRAAYLMYAWGTVFDTHYDYNTVSEFDASINRGGSGSKELYLVNHWLQKEILPGVAVPDSTLAPQANTRSVVSKRVQDCSSANHHFINFIGVDFFHIGDAKAVVDSINLAQ